MIKVTHQGQGHIKVKVKYLHFFKFHVACALCKRVVCIRLKCYLLLHVTDSQRSIRQISDRVCILDKTDVAMIRDFFVKFFVKLDELNKKNFVKSWV